jgi:glycosyltransferase involved in cell wall biosynthesis
LNISVVIPAYNAGDQIAALLQALAAQTSLPAQIIVADDGSGDNTADVAEKDGATVLRLPHGGPAKARNAGAAAASVEIIVFIDSDCIPQPDFLEKLTAPLKSGIADAAKGAYRTRQESAAARFAQLEFEERYAKLSLRQNIDFVDSYAMAIIKRMFAESGGFDGTFPRADNEDVDLSYRLGRMGARMVFVPNAVVFHQHPELWWRYFCTKLGRGYWRFKVYAQYPAKAFHDSYTPQSLKLQMLAMLLFIPAGVLVICFLNLWFLLAPAGLFLLFSLPFLVRAVRDSFSLFLFSLWGLLLRAKALTLGSIAGFWHFIVLKK